MRADLRNGTAPEAEPAPDLAATLRDLVQVLKRPRVEAELLGAKAAAALCGMSPASWHRYVAAGLAPAPVRVGSCVRWRRAELVAWITAGTPPRSEWESRRR